MSGNPLILGLIPLQFPSITSLFPLEQHSVLTPALQALFGIAILLTGVAFVVSRPVALSLMFVCLLLNSFKLFSKACSFALLSF